MQHGQRLQMKNYLPAKVQAGGTRIYVFR